LRELCRLTERDPAVEVVANGDTDAAALGAHRQLGEIEDLTALLDQLALLRGEPRLIRLAVMRHRVARVV
jgi:hypothetical protein